MALAKYNNPDTRPLPPGWSQHYNEHGKVWFYVQDDVVPTRTSYVHPSAIRPGDLDHLNDHIAPIRTGAKPAFSSRNRSFRRAKSTTSEPSFAQQLYASSIKKPPSPAPPTQPSAVSDDTSPLGSRSTTPRELGSHSHHRSLSINLDSPPPPPANVSTQRNYPPQLVAHVSTSATPANNSNSNEHSPTSSRVERPPLTAPVTSSVALVLTPVSPNPVRSAPLSPSDAALFYNSAITPHNTKPYPHTSRPRAGSHSSRPSLSLDPTYNVRRQHAVQATSLGSTSVQSQHTDLTASNSTPQRTRSYQPISTKTAAQRVAVPSRSATFHAGAAASSISPLSSTQTQAVTSPVVVHRRPSVSTAPHTKASISSLQSSAQPSYHLPATKYLVSGSQSSGMSVTTASCWPPPTTYILPPSSSHASLPHGQPSSHSFPTTTSQSVVTASSFPPTPGPMPSASSQPSMLPYTSLPPAPPTFQAAAPARAAVVNQPAPTNKGSMFGHKNVMLGLAAGAAAGIAGGVILNSVLGDDGDDTSGLIDGMGNSMGGSGDVGGGMLDGIFNGDGTGTGSGASGDGNGFQQFSDPFSQGSGTYVDSQNQENTPYFDPLNQGNGNGPMTSVFDQSNQSNLYNQQPQDQQQSGPNLMNYLQQSLTPASNPAAGNYGSAPGGAVQTYQNHHGQTPSGGQHPQQNTFPGYHAAGHHSHNNSLPHGQTLQNNQAFQYGQTSQNPQAGQHNQPLFGQNGRIKPTHVKQFAKGALVAGGILAKLNGVNINN